MTQTNNVVLIGPMGAGKSTIGRFIAQELGFRLVDIDTEIEQSTGADIPWIFDVEGEEGFRRRETSMIASFVNAQETVISTGGGAILSEENHDLLRTIGYVVYLETSVDTQLQRTRKDRKRPLLQCDDPKSVLMDMKAVRNPLYESTAHWTVSTNGQSAKAVGNAIVRHVRSVG